MVIRFPNRPWKALPLFDRLEASRGTTRVVHLTSRQIEHRQRMLRHLASRRRIAQ